MTYEGMKHIRTKKKISRKQMSEDLHIPVSLIKLMETEDIEPVDEDTTNKISNYLGVDDVELVVIDVKQKIEAIELPTNISLDKIRKLFTTVQLKYSPIQNTKQFDTFLAEFKYRLGDLPTNEEETHYIEKDTDLKEDIEEDDKSEYKEDEYEILKNQVYGIKEDEDEEEDYMYVSSNIANEIVKEYKKFIEHNNKSNINIGKVKITENIMSTSEKVYAIYTYLKYLDDTIEGEDIYTLIHIILDRLS